MIFNKCSSYNWLENLHKLLCLHNAEQVKNLSVKEGCCVATSPYKKYVTTVYEATLLGTGGTLLKNRYFFDKEAFLMAHGDNLSKFHIKDFISAQVVT